MAPQRSVPWMSTGQFFVCFFLKENCFEQPEFRIHADVIVYIFAHLHTALRTEGNMSDKN